MRGETFLFHLAEIRKMEEKRKWKRSEFVLQFFRCLFRRATP